MPTPAFNQLRQQVQNARTSVAGRREALFLARERARRLEEDAQQLARIFNPENQAHVARQAALRAAQAANERQVLQLERSLGQAEAILGDHLEALLPQTDPRRQIGELDDRYPILLLPLRLETRFKEVAGDSGANGHELWVRVYPDDVAIDTFEAAPSEAEVRHLRTYWQRLWAAAGRESDQRAAWRELVAGHGAGRALYLVEIYLPQNQEERPTAEDDTVRLVIGSDDPLGEPQARAAADFWEAVWRAGGDPGGATAAREALIASVGEETAAAILANHRPFNLDVLPPGEEERTTAEVEVLTVVFEPAADTATRRQAWSKAPTTDILPDRLVLLGYVGETRVINEVGRPIPSPLAVGPDPQAGESQQMRQIDDELDVGPALRWMVEFDEAVRQGMGFRVSLSPEAFRRGFDRLFVVGVRLTSDEQDGRERLERLLQNHHASRAGLALLPQGTATNNTDDKPADFSHREDADRSFPLSQNSEGLFEIESDPLLRPDGQRLAAALGVNPAILQKVLHAGRSDVADAQAMNVALWPATIGYWMETMLVDVFSDQAVAQTRDFFTQYVSGRGLVPALRIGQQPYGVLPTTAFSRLRWPEPGSDSAGRLLPIRGPVSRWFLFLDKLTEILRRAHGTWSELAEGVAHVGRPDDADSHQTLLDILGLHAASAEQYTRYAQSLAQVLNTMNLHGLGGLIQKLMLGAALLDQGLDILADHGYDVEEQGRPDLLDKYFLQTPTRLSGDLIDDQPLSEQNPIRAYTTDGRNYIRWLADSARVSLEAVRRQEGFADGQPPTALLYLTLRHAINLGYYQTALNLYLEAELLEGEELLARRREPDFIHVATQERVSESRFQLLYQAEPAITQSETNPLIGEFIPTILNTRPVAASLRDQLAALDRLQDLATARLERAFVEHLDCLTYRLDAWLQGLVQVQLDLMRSVRPVIEEEPAADGTPAAGERAGAFVGDPRNAGIYLGAYGWVEDLRPDPGRLRTIDLDDETLRPIFAPEDAPPLLHDPANAGYMHAPSLNQAVTAAVLRNGYLSQSAPTRPELFAVNLSSERVRQAMAVLEGIQGGQSLAALLGYQFERGLHDRHNQAEVDRFIYPLRKKFPLQADHLQDTATDDGVPIQAIEARNVLDGVALVEHVLDSEAPNYPFGLTGLPTATDAQKTAIDAEVQRLLNTHDAVADLGVAEGVHQAVQGNFDRAAAAMEGLSTGRLPPLPDVVQTPRSGVGLTHRVGLHLAPGAPHLTSPLAGMSMSARATAEANLNRWLAGILPPPDTVGVVVRFTARDGTVGETTLTQTILNLQPLDLLYLLDLEGTGEMGALDDLIVNAARTGRRPDTQITIAYTATPPAHLSFFALGALVNHLRGLLLSARPLQAGDLVLPDEADPAQLPLPEYRVERLSEVRDRLAAPLATLETLAAELDPLLVDSAANRANLVAQLDDRLERLLAALAPLNRAGLPGSGLGDLLAWKRNRYAALLDKVDTLLARWQEKLDRFDTLLAAYDALPAATPDAERLEALQEIEKQVAIELTDLETTTPAAYRLALDGRRSAFTTKQGELVAVLATTTGELSALLGQLQSAAVGLEVFDFKRLELDKDEDEMIRFSQEIATLAAQTAADVRRRRQTALDALDAYPGATTAAARRQAAEQAAHALLGEDFLILPEVPLAGNAREELQKAYGDRDVLLTHLRTTAGIDFPVDEWLYGIGRVRDKMNRLEGVVVLAETLSGVALTLDPLQLPYRPGDSWLALPYPDDYQFEGDSLLYTAHFGDSPDPARPLCGLLLDEWTEVIPATEETTGIAFHYDRPNSEPPQVMLLAVTPSIDGRWSWDDLVALLHETLDLARIRAVEPDRLAATDYARFVPATISATTFHPITIALNLALNNTVYETIPGGNDDA